MDLLSEIMDSVALFLETKAKFFMNSNSAKENKNRKLYFSIVFLLVVVSGLLGILFL